MNMMTSLSDEQLAILRLLAAGHTATDVAKELHISDRTLRRRLSAICAQLGVETSIEAVVRAVRDGLA